MAYEQNQEGRDETPNHLGNHARYRAADHTAGAEFASGDRGKRLIRRGTWHLAGLMAHPLAYNIRQYMSYKIATTAKCAPGNPIQASHLMP